MKWGGYWVVVLVLLFVLTVTPVYANPIVSTITKVYILKDNQPVNDPVNFTMNCYGSVDDRLKKNSIRLQNLSPYDPVYSYSLSCSSQGCPLYEYYNTWMMNINYCDIEGTYQGQPFIIRNFSRGPEPECSWVDDYDCEWEWEDTYPCDLNLTYSGIPTSAASECWWNYDNARKKCDLIRESEKNTTSAEDRYNQCDREARFEREKCRDANKTVVNLTWNDVLQNPYNKHSAGLFCELRFSIPSVNATQESVKILPKNPQSVPQSSVATIYCSIVQFLGGRCK